MDRLVAVRFFKIGKESTSIPSLADVLERVGNIDELEKREKQLAPGYDTRLEVFDKDGRDYIVGEMTRIQSTNMPSQISKGKRSSLKDIDRLGHSIVFRYNHRTGIFAIQYDRRVLPPFRFFQYVTAWDKEAKYKSEPIVREDMWERFARKKPRVLEVAIADPSNLSALGKAGEPLGASLRAMGAAYSAPSISIRIAMGYQRGELGAPVKEMVRDLLSRRASGKVELEKLRAKMADDDGPDAINFLEEMLEYKEELELHNKDPDTNYTVKLDYIKRCMTHVR